MYFFVLLVIINNYRLLLKRKQISKILLRSSLTAYLKNYTFTRRSVQDRLK